MDVESYRQQLRQVESALKVAPGDEELTKLKADLEEIIKVSCELADEGTQSNAAPPATSTETSTPTVDHGFTVGNDVFAPYSKDGLLYPAVITAIAAGGESVTVEFQGYKNVEIVAITSLQLQQQHPDQPSSGGGVGSQPPNAQNSNNIISSNNAIAVAAAPAVVPQAEPSSKSAEEALRLAAREISKKEASKNKRLKQIKYREEKKAKSERRQEERKKEVDAWKKFNSSAKRGHSSFKGVKKKSSMFASPMTVDGRVGVIGSDRKMTKNDEIRKKHVFQKTTGEIDVDE